MRQIGCVCDLELLTDPLYTATGHSFVISHPAYGFLQCSSIYFLQLLSKWVVLVKTVTEKTDLKEKLRQQLHMKVRQSLPRAVLCNIHRQAAAL